MKRIIFSSVFILMMMTSKAQIMFIGHRGASYLAPENTVASAVLAWKLGADAVELDIYLTTDNKVMVIHDGNTKRVSGEDHVVKNSSSKMLRKLDVGSFKDAQYKGEKIPFLEEMLKTIPPEKQMVVELKCGPEVLPFLQKVVEKSEKQDQLVFIGFGWNTILATKKAFPENKCYWLSSKKDELIEKMPLAAENKLQGVDLHSSIIDRETMDLANRLNLEVIAWTVDDPAEAKRLVNLGVKGITTNRPAWLKKQLQEN